MATSWTGAHGFDSVSFLLEKFVRFQSSFVGGDFKTNTIHNRVWYFWREWYTNLSYLYVDHELSFISGFPACVVLFHWFRADSYVCDVQKSWNYFFRLPSSVFMGSFNSYELLIIPRLDNVIHNSGFSKSKYSLFIFVSTLLFIIQLPPPIPLFSLLHTVGLNRSVFPTDSRKKDEKVYMPLPPTLCLCVFTDPMYLERWHGTANHCRLLMQTSLFHLFFSFSDSIDDQIE